MRLRDHRDRARRRRPPRRRRRPAAPISALTPLRNMAWSSTTTTRSGARVRPSVLRLDRPPRWRCRRADGRAGRSSVDLQSYFGSVARGRYGSSPMPPCRAIRSMMLRLTPSRSSATSSRSKPGPRSRTNTSTRSSSTSAYTSILLGAGVLGRVDHGLPGGPDQRHATARSASQSPTVDHLDRYAAIVLDLGGGRGQRRLEGLVGVLARRTATSRSSRSWRRASCCTALGSSA